MRHPNKNIALTGIVACILTSCVKAPTSSEPLLSKQADFCNLINIKNTPAGAVDWDAYVFADKGAWMAYSLPDNENRRHACFHGTYGHDRTRMDSCRTRRTYAVGERRTV